MWKRFLPFVELPSNLCFAISEIALAQQIDWRKRSQNRGIRVVVLTCPIFLLSLYFSAQLDRRPAQVIADVDLSQRTRSSLLVQPIARSAADIRLRFSLRVNSASLAEARLRFAFRDPKGALLRGGTLALKLSRQDSSNLHSSTFYVPYENKAWRLSLSLGLPKKSKGKIDDLDLVLIQNPERRADSIYRFADLLLYPSLSILLLGLVMIVGPRLMT